MKVAAQPQLNGQSVNQPQLDSMDLDMDLDLGPLPDVESIEQQEPVATKTPAPHAQDTSVQIDEEPLFDKVHVRGVDEMTTDDVKRFASEHFATEEPLRIEWIDDTSANIVYSSPEVGLQALAQFTQQPFEEDQSTSPPSLRLRTAKTLSTHPESVLQVRTAVKTDRKKQRAHEASRFYLMHPEHDPRERMRREFNERRHRGRRDDGGYSRRRFDDREHRRRKDLASSENFTESMYDDDADAQAGRRNSDEFTGRNGSRGRGRNIEFFPDSSDKSRDRLRNRSASPMAAEFDGDDRSQKNGNYRNRFRDRSPRPGRYHGLLARSNQKKELFPSGGENGSRNRELFPDKNGSTYFKKDLYSNTNHRRSDAFDAADETADLFSKGMSVPFVDGAGGGEIRGNGNRELFPDSDQAGELKVRGTGAPGEGMSIRGASSNGISIKGSASVVRELFPSKYSGNEGKELFSDKLEGRGGRRRRAEDMFS